MYNSCWLLDQWELSRGCHFSDPLHILSKSTRSQTPLLVLIWLWQALKSRTSKVGQCSKAPEVRSMLDIGLTAHLWCHAGQHGQIQQVHTPRALPGPSEALRWANRWRGIRCWQPNALMAVARSTRLHPQVRVLVCADGTCIPHSHLVGQQITLHDQE